MANPITWRTINSRSNEGAAEIMDSAGDSFNKGFDGFNKLLEGAQQTRTDNRDTRIDNNTMDARSFLAGITDPEEMARVQASGEFRDMVQGYGGMVDREALQGAGRERLTGLREMQTTDRNFQDSETRYGNREAREAHDVAIAEGRFDDALKIREETNFLDQGQMAQQQTKAEQNLEQLKHTREQRANSREDRARLEREREAEKAQRELKNQTYARFTAPLEEGETYTTRKQDLDEFIKSDQFKFMAPSERTAFKQQAQKDLEFGEAIAAGDQKKIDTYLEPVKQDLNRNTFYAHENREGDDGTRTRNIIDNYVEENGDEGIGMLLGEADGDDRMKIIQGVQAALSGRTPDGKVLLEGGIPESYIRTALDGVRGGNIINFDSAFADQLEDVISSKAFKQDYESYVSLESRYNQMKSDAQSAARNGAVPTGSAPAPQQPGSPQRPDIPTPTPDTRSVTAPNTPGLTPKGPAVAPVLSNGDAPQEQSTGSPLPRPDLSPINEEPPSESGVDKIMRRFGNLGSYVTNSIKENRHENQVNDFEEITSLVSNGPGNVRPQETRRLSSLVNANPQMLKYMTKEQRNVLRDVLDEGMINQLMKQID